MPAKKPENMTFEETLQALDAIVSELENGELPLEMALKQFERGIAIARQGEITLTEAEQRIEILLTKDDHAALSPFKDEHND